MTDHEQANVATARRYLESIERHAPAEEMASFFAPDYVQYEFPNRLMPNGARRNLQDILDAGARGRKVMTSQRYEVINTVAQGDNIVLEVQWTGTLAVPYESIPVGGEMRARFAVFLEFRDGRIVAQRNYDCFDPW
ncbi:MAG TPA: nuclear transport factor 2 family protein [Thermoanaerobaculia bacterium]|nr:nuclear transport factor 2 family protein [Thermoanaerobaculia bacterium]